MAEPDFIEIGTDDAVSSKAFFASVMGWQWLQMGEGPAGYFTGGPREVGMHEKSTPCVVPYLAVGDIEAVVMKVKAAGGRLMGEMSDAPGLRRFATCSDLCGVCFGLHQE